MYLLCVEPPEGGLPDILKIQHTLVKKNELIPVWHPWIPLAQSENMFIKNQFKTEVLKSIPPVRCRHVTESGGWLILEADPDLFRDITAVSSRDIWPAGTGFILGRSMDSNFRPVSVKQTFRSWKLQCLRITVPENHEEKNGGMWDIIWNINVRSSKS